MNCVRRDAGLGGLSWGVVGRQLERDPGVKASLCGIRKPETLENSAADGALTTSSPASSLCFQLPPGGRDGRQVHGSTLAVSVVEGAEMEWGQVLRA